MRVTLTTNMDVRNPKNPYERFYAHFWRTSFGEASSVSPDVYWEAWYRAHNELNVGIIESPVGKFRFDVEWDEVEYTLFCLKWA